MCLRLHGTSLLLQPCHAGVEPEAVALDLDQMHMMGQTIEQGTGHALVVGKDLRPIRERQIRRHNQTRRFVTLAEEAEQVLGGCTIQWDIAKLIDNDQIATENMIFQLRDLTFFTCFDVGVGQLCRGKAFGFVTPPTSFTSQSNCQVRFARSGGAVKDDPAYVRLVKRMENEGDNFYMWQHPALNWQRIAMSTSAVEILPVQQSGDYSHNVTVHSIHP